MSILIITYNDSYDKINLIDFDQVLYLVRAITPQIQKCKYVDLIRSEKIESDLVDCISKYRNNFDYIVFIDNKNNYDINKDKIISFKRDLPSNWKLNGSKKASKFDQISGYYAEKYDKTMLFVNCKNITAQDIENMKPISKKRVIFPFFSKIIFENYLNMFNYKSLGIIKNNI